MKNHPQLSLEQRARITQLTEFDICAIDRAPAEKRASANFLSIFMTLLGAWTFTEIAYERYYLLPKAQQQELEIDDVFWGKVFPIYDEMVHSSALLLMVMLNGTIHQPLTQKQMSQLLYLYFHIRSLLYKLEQLTPEHESDIRDVPVTLAKAAAELQDAALQLDILRYESQMRSYVMQN